MEEKLIELLGSKAVKIQEKMAAHTTFHIGGEAAYYVTPETVRTLLGAIRLCREQKKQWEIVGNGSNLLVADTPLDKVIISTCGSSSVKNRPQKLPKKCEIEMEELNLTAILGGEELVVQYTGQDLATSGDSGTDVKSFSWSFPRKELSGHVYLVAGAGVMLASFANYAAALSLEGLSFAGGIPGTIGGAVAMNAGAYGGEIKDTIEGAFVADLEGKVMYLDKDELRLAYRDSVILQKSYILLAAVFSLQTGNQEAIREQMKNYNDSRRQKQPLEYASAGSTFKRPQGYFAGKLIQDAGLKGYRVGDIMVSDKHSGFVVNVGKGTAKDVMAVVEHVQEEVMRQFGVKLELEIKILE